MSNVAYVHAETARIHPKQWEFILKSREWSEDEKDSILALLVVEIAHMADFTKDYEPLWCVDDIAKL